MLFGKYEKYYFVLKDDFLKNETDKKYLKNCMSQRNVVNLYIIKNE